MCEAENGQSSRSQRKGIECVMGIVLGQSMACSGITLCSPGFVDGLKLSMCFTSMLLLELNSTCYL